MDDYRARFKSWKCPIRGELTIDGHFAALDAEAALEIALLGKLSGMTGVPRDMTYEDFEASVQRLRAQVREAQNAELARQKTDPFYAPARHILSKTLWTHGRA